jgi:nucleoside-diphosphate-sugar epimerase
VAVTGVSGLLGRRVLRDLRADGEVERVVGIDTDPPPATPDPLDHHRVDLATADLKSLVEDCDTVIHLAFVAGMEPHDAAAARANVDATRRLLDAAADVGARSVVVVSSATAYGAWENNPVPLTEEAPLRPNPGFAYGLHKAEVERVCGEWTDDHPHTRIALLRPAPAVGEDGSSWLARALQGLAVLRSAPDAPPAQFLHLDDLSSAVVHAGREQLDGAFNVAPGGYISAEEVRALAGGAWALPVPDRLVRRLSRLTRELHRGEIPEGLEPYLRHPWVVANDKLVATGWSPAHTNEQAFVAAHRPSRWTEMSPHQRQNTALALSGAAVAAAAAGVVAIIRRRR